MDSALRNKAAYALVDEKGVQEYCSEISPEHLIVCKDTEQGFWIWQDTTAISSSLKWWV